jgi:peptidyl-prolyl cis-trans isomerase SurA
MKLATASTAAGVALAGLLVFSVGCNRKPGADVAAEVNSRPITFSELDKQFKIAFPSQTPESSADQMNAQKLEVLRGMIDNEIMLQRAEKQGLMAVDADVDAKFNELKSPYPQGDFQKQLASRGMTEADLKAQIRRDLSVQKLFNKDITSKIDVTDGDVKAFFEGNRAGFNLAEPQVHLATILVTPQPDETVRNLRSDKAQTEDQAKAKMAMIAGRLKQGEDFAMVAQNFSEDSQTATNGGDMGYVPESALGQASPELQRIVNSLQPGQASPVVRTAEGFRIIKVLSREPAGQRELTDPRVQQSIRETLINRKDQLLRAAYYEVARNEAKISNYYAQQIYGPAKK